MPKKTIHFNKFTNGLYLASDVTEIPQGLTYRNRGIHPLFAGMFRSREGSTQLHAVNAVHSLHYFDDVWYAAASTFFYKGTDQIKVGLSGDRLSFTAMPPTAGKVDSLFVAGGDTLFKVSDYAYPDGSDLITNGDMELDANWANYGTPSTNERSSTQAYDETYSRKFTPDAANEGIQGDTFTTVALSTYKITCYVYPDDATAVRIRVRNGANDAWAYNTLHSSLTENAWNEIIFTYPEASGKGGAGAYIVFEADTATSGDWYVDLVSAHLAYYATDWGIVSPEETLSLADGGAGGSLDDGAIYSYRLTYYNTVTGHRSDPTALASGANVDAETKLLLHCDGADTHTTFTDSSSGVHTVSVVATAQGDTAQKKFGTAALLCDGNSDYLTVPDHADWNFGSDAFTLECQVRFASLAATQGLIGQWVDDNNRMALWCSATRIYFRLGPNSSPDLYVNGTVSFSIDTWYHIAVIRGWNGDLSTWAIVVDGSVVGTTTSETVYPDLAALLWLGRITAGGVDYWLNGWMDEIRVSKGIARWEENFTAPTLAYSAAAIDLAGGSTSIDLTGIPTSPDPQVDYVELWRTEGGGSSYFLLTSLANGTTAYTDDVSDDDLSSTELPTDNIKPYAWFDDCFGPYNASMFWLSREQEGERGRLYYSEIGRAESMEGFIEVSADDKGLQRGVLWQDTPFVFGEAGVYQIYGKNPYFSRQIAGVPGTTKPHTIAVTPIGIMYEAEDGVRLFNGSSSTLASTEDVQLLFRGQAVGALTAFTGVVAEYGRGEYYISDEDQTLAFDIRRHTWRDVGDLSLKSLYYAKDADIIGAGTNADGIYNLENEGDTDDNSNNIAIDLETEHTRLGDDNGGIVQQVHIDHESGDVAVGQTLTVYLMHDGTSTTLGTCANYGRSIDSFAVNRACREFGIRITGSLDDWIKIYRISAEVYVPREETT